MKDLADPSWPLACPMPLSFLILHCAFWSTLIQCKLWHPLLSHELSLLATFAVSVVVVLFFVATAAAATVATTIVAAVVASSTAITTELVQLVGCLSSTVSSASCSAVGSGCEMLPQCLMVGSLECLLSVACCLLVLCLSVCLCLVD